MVSVIGPLQGLQGVRLAAFALAMLLWSGGASVTAAEWKPDKHAEIVVTTSPGGGHDRIARMIQRIIQDNRLVDVVTTVVNKPGGGGTVGLAYLNQHPGDGHYMAIQSLTFLANYVTGRSPISPTDVVPIAVLLSEYVAFAVRAESKINTGRDLMGMLKADAGSISTAISGGIGNHNYVALGLVTRDAGGDLKKLKVAIFNSGGDAMISLLGGHVDLLVQPAATALPHVQSGRVRLIAMTSPKRLGGPFGEVPTWRELGANAVVSNWRMMVGPRGMTAQQTAYWDGVLARVVETDEWKEMVERDLLTNEFLRSREARGYLQAQHDQLRRVLSEFGIARQQ